MKKTVLFSFLFFSLLSICRAQDFKYGTFSHDDLGMKSYKNDTSAHALVLNEYGNAWISSNDMIALEMDYHVKIKIFDSKGFKEGQIELPFYIWEDGDTETYTDIKAVTFYHDENGDVKQAELNPKQVYTTKENKHWGTVKFAMPNVRNGSVIEYSYHLKSFSLNRFKEWAFQSDIPKLSSEYQVSIPAIYNYNISLRGVLKLLEGDKYKGKVDKDCFSVAGTKCDCSKLIFGMKDIPALVEEDYMTSPKNYLSAIYFELSDYINLRTGAKVKVSQEWQDVDRQLKLEDAFGGQMKKKNAFKDVLVPVLAGKTDELEKAKAVYAFIQKSFKWNRFIGIYSGDGVRKAFEKHTGSIADINLALVAALSSAGINSEAVILSTRENGVVNRLYPVITEFNYVVAKANIGDKSYLLDASDPMLSFSLLPMKCLNDQGRVLSLDKPSYWTDLNANQNKRSTYALDLTLQENGKLKGSITNYSFGYDAYVKRSAIKKFNTVDEYVENLDERQPKLKILNSEIINLDDFDKPLSEKYEVEIDVYDNLDNNKFLFNPFMLHKITVNPFKLNERTYPVDWGMPSSERVILTVHLPEKYKIESTPELVSVSLPNDGGKFVTSVETGNNQFTFSHVVQFNRGLYSSAEYPYLKELYNKIIVSEKADIVFKKN
ncbi:hypothetical protein GCM10023149_01140 [Mucilaginibacter gynuensis]|uniref:DUF3857 domain-containing protein n=1 Tax=Mucilaginibacter gynuensis TaxID=1302236 RepID=A0ABP8FN36_9SPHI